MDSELRKLEEEVRKCTRCPLHETRTKPVPGEGPDNAKIMFVGEAPGKNEDLEGRPFVGAAGRLLNELLSVAGLDRGKVYITNVLKCRPPNNRDPRREEILACSPFLERQILIIKPEIVVTLGRHAKNWFFDYFGIENEPLSKIHGNPIPISSLIHSFTLFPTFHPAAALYNPSLRPALHRDFERLRSLVQSQLSKE